MGDEFQYLTIATEAIYALDMLLCKTQARSHLHPEFVTEYQSEEDFYPVRDLRKIAGRYLK